MHINTHRKSAGLKKPVAKSDKQEYSLLDAILNSSENVTIFSLDKNYCYTSFNHSHIRNMKKVWGVDIKAGMNLLECMSIPKLRKLAKASIDRALQGEAFSEVQFQPEVNFYYEFFWNPVYQNKKVIGVTAFIINITDRKLAEDALAKNEALLKQGEIFARFGSWTLDLDTQTVDVSDGVQKIYGDTRDKISLAELKKIRLPEYGSFMDEAMRRLITENEPYDIEFKIKRKSDGKIIDLHSKAQYDAATNTVFGTIQDISKHKTAEEALVKSEMLYRSILNASPDGIVISSLEGRLQLVSPMALKIFRYNSPLEVLGRSITDFVIPDQQEHILEGLKVMYEQSKNSSGEYMAQCRDGSNLPVEVNTSFICNAHGSPTNLITIVRDITERKRAEADLEDSMIKFQGLSDAAYEAIFISENDLCIEQNKMAEKLFGYTAEEAVGMHGTVWIAPEDRAMVVKHVHAEYEEPYEVTALRKDGTSFPCLIRGKQMKYKGRNVRVTSLTDMTEIKEREHKIKRQQQFTEVLLRSIPTPVFYADKEGRYLGCNEAFTNHTGVKAEDMTGKTVMEIWPNELAAAYYQKDLELLKNPERQVFESTITDKHCDLRNVLFAKDVFYDEKGGVAGIVGAYIDITENKRLEAAKTAIQDRIIKIAKQIPGVIYQFRLTPEGNTSFPYISESLYEIFGIRPEEFLEDTRNGFLKIHPEDYEDFMASIMVSAKELSPWQHDCRIVLEGGVVRYLHGSSVPEQEADGAILWHGFLSDVTEQKFTEDRIRQLSKVVEQSPQSIVIANTAGDIQYVNPKFVELTGYSLEEVQGKNPRILSSGNKSKQDYKKLWATILSGKVWQGEFQNKRKDGTIYWESAIISPILNNKGIITQFIAIKSDITESKKMQAALEESEEIFRLLFSKSADAILLLDQNKFTDCNQAAISILGYASRDEVINCTPAALSPKRQPDGMLSTKKAALQMQEALEKGFKRFEWIHTKKDGTDLHVEVMLTSILLKGKPMFYTLWRDITERKIAQQKLQEALESYEFVNKATSDTIWEWDIKTNTINRSENFTGTFGHASGTNVNSPRWANQYIHPDDFEMVKGIVENCIKNKLEHWQAEYRFCAADGTYRYVYDRAFVLFDQDGNPSRMYGAMTDLTEKKNLKDELAEQQLKQQKQLLEVNIQAHEEEKSELGKELHDNISQMLATVKMYLGLAKAGHTIPEFDILGKSYDYVEETIAELRKLSHMLVAPSLGEIGLQEALRDLIHLANLVKDKNIRLVVDKKIKNGGFDKKIELMIYRIVQEQLNNINKYAAAKNVAITVKKEKDWLQLTITDDGVGFDLVNRSKGIGLRNMTNRVEYYAGTLEIITAPGAGCSIHAKIPYNFNTPAI